MSNKYIEYFRLKPDFDMDELEVKYDIKVSQIKRNIKDEVERQLAFEQLKEYHQQALKDLYTEQKNYFDPTYDLVQQNQNPYFVNSPQFAKNLKNDDVFDAYFSQFDELFEDFDEQFENNFFQNTSVSQKNVSTSYNEKRLPDGSKLITTKKVVNNNGVIEETSKSYQKFKDGRIEPVEKEVTKKISK